MKHRKKLESSVAWLFYMLYVVFYEFTEAQKRLGGASVSGGSDLIVPGFSWTRSVLDTSITSGEEEMATLLCRAWH